MTTINLKEFYPWYTHDEYIEVSEEVADELRASRLYEAAYQRRIVRNKAQYSLDCEDGIEYSACVSGKELSAAHRWQNSSMRSSSSCGVGSETQAEYSIPSSQSREYCALLRTIRR